MTNSYTDRDVVGGVTYWYRIRSFNAAGFSPFSNEASVTTPGTTLLPPTAAPVLSANAISDTIIELRWTDVDRETQFRIEKRTSAGEWLEIAIYPYDNSNFVDPRLNPSTFYAYRAFNTAGPSEYSPELIVTTLEPPRDPPGEIQLVARGISHKEILLEWNNVATDVFTTYTVERLWSGGTVHLAFLSPSTTNYTAIGLQPSLSGDRMFH